MPTKPHANSHSLATATTAGAWLHVVLRTLEAASVDGAKLALESDVPARNLRHAEERVPQAAMTLLWKAAVRATGNPCFGLDVALHVTGSTFGALTHVAFVSPTLSDAFHRIVRFQRLMTDAMRIRLDHMDDRCRLTTQPIAPDHPPAEELDAFWATWVRVVRKLAPKAPYVEPLRVHLRRPRPGNAELFDRVFRVPIQFGSKEDFVEYGFADCLKRLPDQNLDLAEEYDQILARQAAALQSATISDKVRALLFETMTDGPTESDVAKRLFMSKSSLKAALARESTSYKAILEEVRRTLALRYLRKSAYSVKEIAFLLGYAESSAFSRAFKRWTGGMPPGSERATGD